MKAKYHIAILTILIGIFSLCYGNNIQKASSINPNPILSPKLLNSERIKAKFGSYGIKILQNNPKIRVSNLYSTHDGIKTTRTFALVHYASDIDDAFSKEHIKIINGQSIGRTFKRNKWKIEKKSIYIGEIAPSNKYKPTYKLMGDIAPSTLAIYIYEFHIQKSNKDYLYATISEIYHPDYIAFDDLRHIVANGNKYLQQTDFAKQILKQVQDKLKASY